MKEINLFIKRLFAELYELSQTNASSGIIILCMTLCAAAITALTFVIGLENIANNVIVGVFGFDSSANNWFLGIVSGVLSFFMYFTLFVLSLNQKPVKVQVVNKDGDLEWQYKTNKGLYWRSLTTIAIAEITSVLYFISTSTKDIDVTNISNISALIIGVAIMLCVQGVVISFLHTATELFYRQGIDDKNVTNVRKENDMAADISHNQAIKSISGGAKASPSASGGGQSAPSQSQKPTTNLNFNLKK